MCIRRWPHKPQSCYCTDKTTLTETDSCVCLPSPAGLDTGTISDTWTLGAQQTRRLLGANSHPAGGDTRHQQITMIVDLPECFGLRCSSKSTLVIVRLDKYKQVQVREGRVSPFKIRLMTLTVYNQIIQRRSPV